MEDSKEVRDFWQGSGAYDGLDIVTGSNEAVERFLERNVVIPRGVLPVVGVDEWRGVNAPPEYHERIRKLDGRESPEKHRLIAFLEIARAEHYEKEQASSALKRRRDELAAELSHLSGATFRELSPTACNAIDRIIEMEAAK